MNGMLSEWFAVLHPPSPWGLASWTADGGGRHAAGGRKKTGGPLGNFDIGAVSELPGDGAGYPRSVTYGDSSPLKVGAFKGSCGLVVLFIHAKNASLYLAGTIG